ncbi:MAG: hypothetical protein HF982_08345 [Desulfobacteraceae bacterium]|nr:hypothetical protein [Desulfobacteraceae bacterium]MBC2719579.1 hypothetical protein [Desulfobacteraceae bacterium]
MNRNLDYRSDFYSLGVTFYELLSGKKPFETDDPMELFHCHIAKVPVPLHELDTEIPKAVSIIVMKLLSKNADNRYKSARGIANDLQKCLTSLKKTGKIEPFLLAVHDITDKFQISQKLYGREKETNVLIDVFDKERGRINFPK